MLLERSANKKVQFLDIASDVWKSISSPQNHICLDRVKSTRDVVRFPASKPAIPVKSSSNPVIDVGTVMCAGAVLEVLMHPCKEQINQIIVICKRTAQSTKSMTLADMDQSCCDARRKAERKKVQAQANDIKRSASPTAADRSTKLSSAS